MNPPIWALPGCTGTKYYCAEHEDFMKFWSDTPRLVTPEEQKWFKKDRVYCQRCLHIEGSKWGRSKLVWRDPLKPGPIPGRKPSSASCCPSAGSEGLREDLIGYVQHRLSPHYKVSRLPPGRDGRCTWMAVERGEIRQVDDRLPRPGMARPSLYPSGSRSGISDATRTNKSSIADMGGTISRGRRTRSQKPHLQRIRALRDVFPNCDPCGRLHGQGQQVAHRPDGRYLHRSGSDRRADYRARSFQTGGLIDDPVKGQR